MAKGQTHSLIAVADLLGVSRVTVTKWLKAGCPYESKADISRRKEWELSLPDVVAWREQRAVEQALNEHVGNEEDHKTRLLKARADLAGMDAERQAGNLVPVDEVEKTWTDIVTRFRQRALAVAPKAAPMVAVENTTEACHEIIEAFVHEALAELAATPVVGHAEDGAAGDSST